MVITVRHAAIGIGVLASALAATAAAVPAAAAGTAPVSAPVVAGLAITPSITTVGTTVRIVGTATNTTANPVQASLGIDNYASLHITSVAGSPGCTPRNLTHLVYCGVQSLAPGSSATITLTITPATTGAFDFRSYARITYTTGDSFAYGTLSVS
ncbi:hypothetical protein ACFFWC_19390 [Plantactinospora siamensis]|uniref:DUF11 domain-containing protein n=1 Tax=Plantactinospora siamensis TaxID=555372 RepID=A0ABV6P3K7_9ACTN